MIETDEMIRANYQEYRLWFLFYNKKGELVKSHSSDPGSIDQCRALAKRNSTEEGAWEEYATENHLTLEYEIRRRLYTIVSHWYGDDASYFCEESAPLTAGICERVMKWEHNSIDEGRGYGPKMMATGLKLLLYTSELQMESIYPTRRYSTQCISPLLEDGVLVIKLNELEQQHN